MPEEPFDPDGFPPLQPDTTLHACLTCGAAVPSKALAIHSTWHDNIAAAAIRTEHRVDRIEGSGNWSRHA